MPDDILAAPSSEPARQAFRTALAHLVHEYSLDMEAGRPAEEIAAAMDETRERLARTTRQARDDSGEGP